MNTRVAIGSTVGPQATLAGGYIATLMRRNKVTIRGLAARMQITQKRIREVLQKGVSGPCMCNDWFEGCTQTGIFKATAAGPAEQLALAKTKTFSGYVRLGATTVRVDFQVPASASKAELDSAFVDSLAQMVEINYLEIGAS